MGWGRAPPDLPYKSSREDSPCSQKKPTHGLRLVPTTQLLPLLSPPNTKNGLNAGKSLLPPPVKSIGPSGIGFTAFQRLRRGKHFESLDEAVCNEERDFRPRQVRAWQDNPEELYSKSEMRQLVERGILALPANYRVVVMLRDIQQLSTDEVARQLGLSVPAVKTRLLRGRVMPREWLSPHFANRVKGIAQ